MEKSKTGLYTESDRSRERPIQYAADFPPEKYRSEWRRDYARLIHSPAFRRLQGKSQLFPGIESDFFRNRLSHSIEVAQIAKSIAIQFNSEDQFFSTHGHQIDTDLVELAGLAHDLGHPPFGHTGELALDECMLEHGGFEGNAQTLRILARLEKKETDGFPPRQSKTHPKGYYLTPPQAIDADGRDHRLGLNLTYRSLAAVLKYDSEIPRRREHQENGKVTKGYYYTEASLIERIKKHVLNVDQPSTETFKTIECDIMDLADDIAYSTYDLEDAFKADFLSPIGLFAKEKIFGDVADKINKSKKLSRQLTAQKVREILHELFATEFLGLLPKAPENGAPGVDAIGFAKVVSDANAASTNIASLGYVRTDFTSGLVGRFVRSVRTRINERHPSLSSVYLEEKALEMVEVLKQFTYCALISSPRLKVVEYRGREIVQDIFRSLVKSPELLPDDFRDIHDKAKDESEQKRVICDFIAGMTDRYAVEFYARLRSENARTIFKPF